MHLTWSTYHSNTIPLLPPTLSAKMLSTTCFMELGGTRGILWNISITGRDQNIQDSQKFSEIFSLIATQVVLHSKRNELILDAGQYKYKCCIKYKSGIHFWLKMCQIHDWNVNIRNTIHFVSFYILYIPEAFSSNKVLYIGVNFFRE